METAEATLDFSAELDFFIANQDQLVEQYDGRVLILRYQKVEGDYGSMDEAYEAGRERFGLGNFMIQPCFAGEAAYTRLLVSHDLS
ncbi:hypothetical protein [Candidatus Palauibacter sp.]|uniref:hypothetical protein n=1 Tax=Candidatus Palauibacter sp. TaxID=3101350 RepID=UPI003B0187EC